MPDRYLYLVIDAGVILIPFLFSFHPRIRFDRYFVPFLKAATLTFIPFLIWDVAFTETGVWGFNPRYLTGINLLGLPIEEWLFFYCIPFSCVFVFHAAGLIKTKPPGRIWYISLALVSLFLFIVAVFNGTRAYTFLTGILTALTLGYLSIFEKPEWLPRAVVAYIVVIPFFFISNGLLTGSWIEDEIVWYNNAENLEIRMWTIPVEDTVYGFLLILLNIMLIMRFTRPGLEPQEIRTITT